MISVIFGVLFTFGMIFGVGVIAGDPMALVDLITLGVVIGLSLIGTIFSSMAKPRSELFSNFGNFSVIAGWIAFLMGATIISGSMDLGDLKNLGPAAFLFPSGKIVDQSLRSRSYSFFESALACAKDKKIIKKDIKVSNLRIKIK